jgi:hypothetical protein
MTLTPSPEGAAAFHEVAESIQVGGEEPAAFALITLTGDRRRFVYPRVTFDHFYVIANEILADPAAGKHYSLEAVVNGLTNLAGEAAEHKLGHNERETKLRALFASFSATPGEVRSLYVVGPLMYFPEDMVEVGPVRFYRATETNLNRFVPELQARKGAMYDEMTKRVRDHLVADIRIDAEPIRARDIAAEKLTLALAIVALDYSGLYQDWPGAGLERLEGAAVVSLHPNGTLSSGRAQFFAQSLMQFPRDYLPYYLASTPARRLSDILADRRTDEIDQRLRLALHWWASANEVGPWPMRLVKYVTVFEALFGRTTERRVPGKAKRLSQRVAAMVASAPDKLDSVERRAFDLYDLRSECVHEGSLLVEPASAFDAMRLGAVAITYLARSTLTQDKDFHHHLDQMVKQKQPWNGYARRQKIDPGR